MSDQKTKTDDKPLETAAPAKTAVKIKQGHTPTAILPTDIEGLWRFAQALSKSTMIPESYLKGRGGSNLQPDAVCGNVFAAIQTGAEIGLSPMQAIQSIAMINQRPCLWGDGLIGVVRGSGKCKWIKETVTGEAGAMVAHCETERVGGEVVMRSFSWADANKAGLITKGGDLYKKYPARMLAMRARGFCLRDTYADVLKGISSADEMMDAIDLAQNSDGSFGTPTPPPPTREGVKAQMAEPEPEEMEPARMPEDEQSEAPDTPEPEQDEPAPGAEITAPQTGAIEFDDSGDLIGPCSQLSAAMAGAGTTDALDLLWELNTGLIQTIAVSTPEMYDGLVDAYENAKEGLAARD